MARHLSSRTQFPDMSNISNQHECSSHAAPTAGSRGVCRLAAGGPLWDDDPNGSKECLTGHDYKDISYCSGPSHSHTRPQWPLREHS